MPASLLICAALLAACGSGGSDGGAPRTGTIEGEVTVLAASSLAEVFEDLADAFETEHPGTVMRLSFAASPTIVAQVQEGAPADLVTTADDLTMTQLVDSGDVGETRTFARNELAIAVERGNPEHIRGLEDLARPRLVVVLCDTAVPCGRMADEALANAGVEPEVASREQNVKATLAKVALGEADAAIVYATDTAATDAVDGVAIPAGQNVSTALPIATIDGAENAGAAEAFADFVLSDTGREILVDAGFLEP